MPLVPLSDSPLTVGATGNLAFGTVPLRSSEALRLVSATPSPLKLPTLIDAALMLPSIAMLPTSLDASKFVNPPPFPTKTPSILIGALAIIDTLASAGSNQIADPASGLVIIKLLNT